MSKYLKIKSRQGMRTENNEIEFLKTEIETFSGCDLFNQLPISQKTKLGLFENHFLEMTPVQKATIPTALKGDINIASIAKTGSGKTLAFLIPVLELLYRDKWSKEDGLGALIITPTRELAVQIFDVLRKVGIKHSFSAGLLIGGKSVSDEKKALLSMNILVTTPGRLLQHMDQTANFDCSNLKILILDEMDRILDLGFSSTMNAIIENLPFSRQNLLFSATKNSFVDDFTKKYEKFKFFNLTETDSFPKNLKQFYKVLNLEEKVDFIFNFIKRNLRQKIIVFVSTCKQVRFLFEAFCKLQPGIPILCLHGKQKQHARTETFYSFCRKKHSLLFATDLASRGLDFPSVDWVVQLDCPDDFDSYIHRIGRTARYNSDGQSLTMFLPKEFEWFQKIKNDMLQLDEYDLRQIFTIKPKLKTICASNPDIKYLAQRALVCYIKSLFLKNELNTNLELADFADSLGLATVPKLKIKT